VFLCAGPDPGAEAPFRIASLSDGQRRWARLTGALNLFRSVLRWRPDAVQLNSIEQLPLGIALKLLTRCVVVYDNREDMFNSMLHSKVRFPLWQRRLLARATRLIEGLGDRLFDGIVTADPGTGEVHSAMPPERRMVFYNAAMLPAFGSDHPPLVQRDVDLVLMGSMSKRSGIMVLVDALAELHRRGRELRTLLLGDLPPEVSDEVHRRLEDLGLAAGVQVTGRVPPEEVPSWLRRARIGLVLLLDDPKFRNNIAKKAFEYMACRMPTVSSDLPPERIFLRHGHNALLFEPGNPKALADTVELLLDDPGMAQRLADQARADAEKDWNAKLEQEKLRGFYRTLLESPRGPLTSTGSRERP